MLRTGLDCTNVLVITDLYYYDIAFVFVKVTYLFHFVVWDVFLQVS